MKYLLSVAVSFLIFAETVEASCSESLIATFQDVFQQLRDAFGDGDVGVFEDLVASLNQITVKFINDFTTLAPFDVVGRVGAVINYSISLTRDVDNAGTVLLNPTPEVLTAMTSIAPQLLASVQMNCLMNNS